jgi:membrane protein YqaA with SNARE-associated domain
MHKFLRHAYLILAHLGGFGLLTLSVLDSSPLYVPFGNDLFMIAMTAKNHRLLFYYAFMAATGSVLGCLTVDVLSRKGGEKGFERTVSRRRFDYIKRQVTRNAEWALVMASLMPPPFPYTGIVAGTAAFQYPRRRLLTIIFVSRFVRFSIVGILAILFSQKILQFARSSVVDYVAIALVVVSVAVSAFIIWTWIKRSRSARDGQPPQ